MDSWIFYKQLIYRRTDRDPSVSISDYREGMLPKNSFLYNLLLPRIIFRIVHQEQVVPKRQITSTVLFCFVLCVSFIGDITNYLSFNDG